MLRIHRFINRPVTSNCFVLFDKEKGDDCIIIDPGSKNELELFEFINKEVLRPQYIILTHEHFDHCWGVNALVQRFHIPIICSQLCAEAIKYKKRNCSVFYDNKEAFVINSETISIESLNFKKEIIGRDFIFFNTPGHSDASISIVIDSCLFTGDTLIKDERTVTKLPTGSVNELKDSLELFISLQGKGYCVYPGHGESFVLDSYDLKHSL